MHKYLNNYTGHRLNIRTLPCPDYVKEWLNYLVIIRNLNDSTVLEYYKKIERFLRWLCTRGEDGLSEEDREQWPVDKLPFEAVGSVTQMDILDYLAYCGTAEQNSASTRAGILTALKGFYAYFCREDPSLPYRIEKSPAEGIHQPKTEERLPIYLTENECVQVLRAMQADPIGECPERDFCMMTFFMNCGMRIAELVGINIADIREGYLRLFGKGRREREVWLNEDCRKSLEQWLIVRGTIAGSEEEPALFISKRTGKRITDRRVRQIIDRVIELAGLGGNGYSPHKLRHSAATMMYQSGADLLELKTILGHANTSTTEIYTHLSEDRTREVMDRLKIGGKK